MLDFKSSNPLARKLLLYILICSSLFTLVTTGLQLFLDYKNDINQIEVRLNQVYKGIQQGVSTSLWNLDEHQLNAQLKGILHFPDIIYVAVSTDYRIISVVGKKKKTSIIEKKYSLFFQNNFVQEKIGSLHIIANLDTVYSRLIQKSGVILVSQGIKTSVISLVILFLFRSLVTKHLNKMAAYTSHISVKKENFEFLTLDRAIVSFEQDELEQVVKSINSMRLNMQNSYFELHRELDARQKIQLELKARVKLEKLVSDISTKFISLPYEKTNDAIIEGLCALATFTRVDRVRVYRFSADQKMISLSYKWMREGVTSTHLDDVEVSSSDFQWMMGIMSKKEVVRIDDLDTLPESAILEKQWLELEFITSYLAVPLIEKQQLVGFLSFENIFNTQKWRDEYIAMIFVVGEIFLTAIEREKAGIARAEREQRYKMLFAASTETIIIFDAETLLIQECNPSGFDLYGYSQSEMLNVKVSDIFKNPKNIEDSAKKFKVGERKRQEIDIHVKQDSSIFLVSFDVGAFEWNKEKVMFLVVKDITKQKEVETILEDYNKSLEIQVEGRTKELKKRNEELGIALRTIERSNDRIQNIQKELLETAHNAGMAEITTGILHNIGNVLSGINIANQEVLKILGYSRLPQLYKVREMLDVHKDDLANFFSTDKGTMLISFLDKLIPAISDESFQINQNSRTLQSHMQVVSDIIQTQQEYAHSGLFAEKISLPHIIDDTISLQKFTYEKQKINVDKQYQYYDEILVQKSKLVQILINLFKNSREAMFQNNIDDRYLLIKVFKKEKFVLITVTDNGCGISEGNLNKIFQHGFTTKETGHGFGLHLSANYMTEMGGKLEVKSERKGASFTLKFPLFNPKLDTNLKNKNVELL
ncbi:MAG: PAS domain S-box-containing protein [bacterium]|jgi:PAS domain S-box-containing protein